MVCHTFCSIILLFQLYLLCFDRIHINNSFAKMISHDDDDYNDYNEITFLNHSVNRAGDIVFYSVAFAIFEQLSDFIC